MTLSLLVYTKVKAAHKTYMDEVQRLANQVFLGEVLPFCRRYDLRFVRRLNAFKGDKFFYDPANPSVGSSEWDDWLDHDDLRDEMPECKPPPGYSALRCVIDKPLPNEDELCLRYFMPEHRADA